SPLRRSTSWSAGHLTSLVTIKPLPSGSHTGSDTPSGRLLNRRASPPPAPIGRIQSCGLFWGGRLETNARVLPSGDQRGSRSDPGPCVSWRVSPVRRSASQMRVVPRFSLSEYSVTLYATHLPSGESAGSPTDFIAM